MDQDEYSRLPLTRYIHAILSAKEDLRSTILVTNGILELFVTVLVNAHCKNAKKINSDTRGYPYSTKLIILNEVGVLSDGLFQALDWFRKVRNDAAHKPILNIDKIPEVMQVHGEYKTAEGKTHRSSTAYQKDDFHQFCLDLVCGFWNGYTKILAPVFMKSDA